MAYVGGWTEQLLSSAYGGSVEFAEGVGGERATFSFTGSEVAWIAHPRDQTEVRFKTSSILAGRVRSSACDVLAMIVPYLLFLTECTKSSRRLVEQNMPSSI